MPVIFKGKLSEKQLQVIELYLNTSKKDAKYIFNENNFAFFLYKILNPQINNSFLMHNDEFNNNLEKIIIKIDNNTEYSFEILNPLYKRLELTNNTEYVQIYSLILIKFLEFCQLMDLDKYKIRRINKDEMYVEYMCELFNEFMGNCKGDIENWRIEIPDFFKEEKFKLNIDLINNKKTRDYVKGSEKSEYIFKVILGSFNRKRKKPVGIFTEQTLSLFNEFVARYRQYFR